MHVQRVEDALHFQCRDSGPKLAGLAQFRPQMKALQDVRLRDIRKRVWSVETFCLWVGNVLHFSCRDCERSSPAYYRFRPQMKALQVVRVRVRKGYGLVGRDAPSVGWQYIFSAVIVSEARRLHQHHVKALEELRLWASGSETKIAGGRRHAVLDSISMLVADSLRLHVSGLLPCKSLHRAKAQACTQYRYLFHQTLLACATCSYAFLFVRSAGRSRDGLRLKLYRDGVGVHLMDSIKRIARGFRSLGAAVPANQSCRLLHLYDRRREVLGFT
jgi:hypothetical protein